MKENLLVSAHEAGALHSPGYGGTAVVPAWLRPPTDVNELLPRLWARSVRRSAAGVLEVGGVDVEAIAEQHGTPAYVIDEADFRARATAYRDAFAGAFPDAGVYYAGKAFLCTEVARWVAADGLRLDVCTGGELAVALRAGLPGDRITLHGNNKSDSELERAVRAGVGQIVLDSLEEIDRVADTAAALGVRAGVLIRVTVGVEAHTHEYIATAHEDQKFGLSLAEGHAAEAVRRVLRRPELELRGLHSHIGSQIFDTAALRGLGPARPRPARAGRQGARLLDAGRRPRRRLRDRLHLRARPAGAQAPGRPAGRHRHQGVPRAGHRRPPGDRSSRAGRSPGRAPSPCTGSGR